MARWIKILIAVSVLAAALVSTAVVVEEPSAGTPKAFLVIWCC